MPTIAYKGWPNCFQMSNGLVDLIATTDVGPRIIRFGFSGADNMFKEYQDMLGKTGGKTWNIYGGHRFWLAPEAEPRTYALDNAPVKLEDHKTFIRLIQDVEPSTRMQKELDIHLDAKEAHVRVVHRVYNRNLWAVETAPWGVSVMAQGGKAIIPLPPRGPHPLNLAPCNTLTMWAYTDMTDPRWTWGNKYIMLRQDPTATGPTKIGVMDTMGWAAYANKGFLFVKAFSFVPGAAYPDMGCSIETFTNSDMLELESLAPLVTVQPEAKVEYVEDWYLFRDIAMPASDADVDKNILPKITALKG
jgi:hypothetical protein